MMVRLKPGEPALMELGVSEVMTGLLLITVNKTAPELVPSGLVTHTGNWPGLASRAAVTVVVSWLLLMN